MKIFDFYQIKVETIYIKVNYILAYQSFEINPFNKIVHLLIIIYLNTLQRNYVFYYQNPHFKKNKITLLYDKNLQ
jgi:hypothetical protein